MPVNFSNKGYKWELANHIYKTVGTRPFKYAEIGNDPSSQSYLRAMLDCGMITRIQRKTWKDPAVYQLTPTMIDKIRRYGE